MKYFGMLVVFAVLFCALGTAAHAQEVQVGTFTFVSTAEGAALASGSGERTATAEITFTKPFEVKPEIVLSINLLDADKAANTRVSLKPASISRDGFTIQVKTWADTKINSIGITWVAVSGKK
jgi:hypothetical protein